MTPLLELLLAGLPPGARHVDRFDSVQRRLAASFGIRFTVIDVEHDATKPQLLAEVAVRLGFPEWFGHNWDALYDSLGDLPLAEADTEAGSGPELIVVRNANEVRVMSTAASALNPDVATLIDVFSQAARDFDRSVLFAGFEIGVGATGQSPG